MKYLEFLGPLIKHHREMMNINIGTVCIQTDIQKPQYIAIEEGKREVLLNTWKRICDAVNLDFISLFKNLEVYETLYDVFLHALLYDNIEEQDQLYQNIMNEKLSNSILLPKFTLLNFLYYVINHKPKEAEAAMRYLNFFENAFMIEEKSLYYDYKGFFYQQSKQFTKALSYYKKAENLSAPKYKEFIHYHYGMLYYKMNDPMVALYYYQEAYVQFEKAWNINRLLYTKGGIGICYSRIGEYTLAKLQMEETIHLAKQYHNDYVICNTLDNMAFNSFKMRDFTTCTSYALKAIQLKSSFGYLYFYLAYSYCKLNDYEKAVHWIEASKQQQLDHHICRLIGYVQLMVSKEDYVDYLHELYREFVTSDLFELQKFALVDLADLFRERKQFEYECRCLRELIKITQAKY